MLSFFIMHTDFFRFLRTADEHLNFAKDMERLCPDALMLNYTNPLFHM